MQQGSLFSRTVCVVALLIIGDGLLLGCGELAGLERGDPATRIAAIIDTEIPVSPHGHVLVIPRNTGCPDCDATGGTDPIRLGTGNSHRSELDDPPFGGVAAFTRGNGQRYIRRYNTDGRIASYTLG